MGHIFISYSHKDKKYVYKLQEALQQEGFKVWIDERIGYGTEWPRIIQQHLDECDAFIVVVTENAYESKWVQNEVARADRKGKPFFPLLLEGDPWLTVEATQYVDVRNGSLPNKEFMNRLATVTPRNVNENPVEPGPKPALRTGINWPEVLNTRTQKIITKIGIAVAIFVVLVVSVFSLGSVLGFIKTDNSSVSESSLVSGITMSTGLNSTQDIYTFTKEQEIYASFNLGVQTSAEYQSKWYYTISFFGKDVNFLIVTLNYTGDPFISGVIFQLNNPGIAGNYRVDIYRDQMLMGRRYFSIE
jgi:hypothetical protein